MKKLVICFGLILILSMFIVSAFSWSELLPTGITGKVVDKADKVCVEKCLSKICAGRNFFSKMICERKYRQSCEKGCSGDSKSGTTKSGTTNIALYKTYVSSPTPSAIYPDTNNQQLTNGLIREEVYDFQIESTVGWLNLNPIVVVDLGNTYFLNKVRIYVGGGDHAGIRAPTDVSVFYSLDGQTWKTGPSKHLSNYDEQWVELTFPPAVSVTNAPKARYVKIVATNPNHWTMIGDIEVYGR